MRFNNQSRENEPNEEEDDDEDEKLFESGEDFDDDLFFDDDTANVKFAELSLVESNLKRRIISNIVKMFENSFWWRFTTHKERLVMIAEAYETYDKLIND